MTSEPRTRIGIVTVSDRAHRGEYEDRGGPAVHEYLETVLATDWEAVVRIVPDDRSALEEALRDLADHGCCCLVITTGGTGPTARDVTPEATSAVCEKILPGFGERMRHVSSSHVPTAILARQSAGVRGSTLIINLPGQPQAIIECLDAVFSAVPHCVRLLGGPALRVKPNRNAPLEHPDSAP